MPAIFEIVVDGFEFTAIPNSPAMGSPNDLLPPLLPTAFSQKVKIDGKGVFYSPPASYTVAPGSCTLPGATHMTGSFSVSANANKVSVEGNQCFLKLAMTQAPCSGQFVLNANGAPMPCACTIMIKDPGQTLVKGS